MWEDEELIDVSVREEYPVNTRRLDTFVREKGVDWQVDLLKLDIQGAELLALEGAVETLKRTRFVWTEVSFAQLYDGACVFPQVFDFLSSHGFALMEITSGFRGSQGELLQADALFQRL